MDDSITSDVHSEVRILPSLPTYLRLSPSLDLSLTLRDEDREVLRTWSGTYLRDSLSLPARAESLLFFTPGLSESAFKTRRTQRILEFSVFRHIVG